jgi:4-hydroxy-tetrahydrodipicolinate synthase
MKNNNYDSFHGIFTALITPFDTENNNINFSELAYLINFQIENNANGILLLGSTSESQSLSEKEKLDIVDLSLDIIEKKIPVIIGINYNDTSYACYITNKFLSILKKKNYTNKDACFLVNNPSYNRPTEDGIFLHFSKIHDEVSDFPILIYNIPSRAIFDLKNDFLKKIFSKLDLVIGIKDCSSDILRVSELSIWAEKYFNNSKKLRLFCGDDAYFFNHLINGGCGCISVLSNIFVSHMRRLYDFFINKNFESALSIYKKFIPIIHASLKDSNPSVIKYLMSSEFGTKDYLRPPLLSSKEENKILLKNEYEKLKSILNSYK